MEDSGHRRSGTTSSAGRHIAVFLVGVYLGILFITSEVASWNRIHAMFLFQEARMYLIIGTAIATSMVSIFLIHRIGMRSLDGRPIQYEPKPWHRGVAIGGLLFGAGWAVTGACPGPVYAQIGAGELMALWTLSGALLGMLTYAALRSRLPH